MPIWNILVCSVDCQLQSPSKQQGSIVGKVKGTSANTVDYRYIIQTMHVSCSVIRAGQFSGLPVIVSLRCSVMRTGQFSGLPVIVSIGCTLVCSVDCHLYSSSKQRVFLTSLMVCSVDCHLNESLTTSFNGLFCGLPFNDF